MVLNRIITLTLLHMVKQYFQKKKNKIEREKERERESCKSQWFIKFENINFLKILDKNQANH